MREILPVADRATVRRYARTLSRRHPRELWLAISLHVLAAVAGLATPWLLGHLVASVQTELCKRPTLA